MRRAWSCRSTGIPLQADSWALGLTSLTRDPAAASEVLNETNSDEVIALLIGWVESVVTPI